MQLFNTKVVPSSNDALWSLPDDLPSFSGKELLILSLQYAAGGPEQQTLHKMLAACKLHESQYAVLQLGADEKLSWPGLVGAEAPPKILLLGISPAQLGIYAQFRLNTPNSFMGHTIVPSHGLSQIEGNPEMKKELWVQGLKPLFGL